jgi:hypothetical protein
MYDTSLFLMYIFTLGFVGFFCSAGIEYIDKKTK